MKRMKPPKNLGKALKAGYMPMFMTGPEIKEHFPPLEGDKRTVALPEHEKANRYDIGERKETDSELWDRKLKESKLTGKQRYGKDAFERDRQGAWRSLSGPSLARQGIGPDTSLESVAKTSGMPGYIALQSGKLGTGQVLGGHHRVALSAEQFKDHIFPVKYFKSLPDAKLERDYQ
jgi:hypothetical protein